MDKLRKLRNGIKKDGFNIAYKKICRDNFLIGVKYGKRQMINDDSFLVAVGRAYMDWVDGGINTNDVPPADYIRENYKKFMV